MVVDEQWMVAIGDWRARQRQGLHACVNVCSVWSVREELNFLYTRPTKYPAKKQSWNGKVAP
jgi:hypothetical protein